MPEQRSVKPIAPIAMGGTDIVFAQGMRAGNWLFFTGHEATDFDTGLASAVHGQPGLPLHGLPRFRREGDVLMERLNRLLEAEGSDLRHAVRLDQYYPTARAVDPYHHARRARFGKGGIPPSTSIVMKELLVKDAAIDVSLLAVMPGSDRAPRRAELKDVPVPPWSGYAPCVISGDYVFVAGQMANENDKMAALHPKAQRSPNARWGGTDIRLQTEFLITDRLEPAMRAGGSSLSNAIKAQVYLGNMEDLPDFLDVWNAYFAQSPCALTIVPASSFGLGDAIIEINLFGVRDDGRTKKQIIEVDTPQAMRFGPGAVRAGDLVCLSGLVAAGAHGPIAHIGPQNGLGHLGAGAIRQMRYLLDAAARTCEAAGTTLDNVVRAQHFHTDLAEVYPTLRTWSERLPDVPLPFGAVGTTAPLPVPGTTILLDMWAYAP
jgi:enamine deaminase RidA (YjgF/YER057c/UK114 family)